MRVLLLGTTVPVRSGDGTPSFVLDLAVALSANFNVTVLAPRVNGSVPVATSGGVVVRRFPYFPRRWERLADDAIMPRLRAQPWRVFEAGALVLSMIWHSWRAVRREKPDLVNAHWIIPGGIAAWVVRKTLRTPYVLTVHGADAFTLNGRLGRWLKLRVLLSSSSVSPVSSEIGGVIRELGVPESLVQQPVPMGVSIRAVGPGGRTGGPFLFVGRLAQKKGLDVAIRALAIVPEARLRVIGEGPERAKLDALVGALGVGDRVEFIGRCGRERVFEEMEGCVGLLVPSVEGSDGDKDGMPVVVAEAMSGGLPVIASDIGGLGEHVIDGCTGWLLAPGDVDAWAQCLGSAISDPERFAEFGLEARKRFGGSPLDILSTARSYERTFLDVAR